MENHFIETARGNFHYREFGRPENPAIVMLHGWPQTSFCWKEVAALLADAFHVITPDLRGMGESNRALEEALYSKDEMAKDMIAILDAKAIDTFFLAGHDWGAGVSQEMVFLVPERIRKQAILNFPVIHNRVGQLRAYKVLGEQLFAPFWYQFFLRMRELPEAMIQGKEDPWVRFFVKGVKKEIEEEAIAEYIRCYQIPNSATTYANLYRTMGRDIRRWNGKGYLGKKIEMETLIIHGALDRVIVKEYFEGVGDCFSNVAIKWVDAGHFVLDEKSIEVADILRTFFVN